jgi:hypothetical protein
MKKRIHNPVSIVIMLMLAGLGIALSGCESETPAEQTQTAPQNKAFTQAPFDQLPLYIQSQALTLEAEFKKQTLNAKKERRFGAIRKGTSNRLQREDGRTSYTLALNNTEQGLYYDNLVIEEAADGSLTTHIIRYQPELSWYGKHTTEGLSYAEFSGSITVFDGMGAPLSSVTLASGQPVHTLAKGYSAKLSDEALSCEIVDIDYVGGCVYECWWSEIIITLACSVTGGDDGMSDPGYGGGTGGGYGGVDYGGGGTGAGGGAPIGTVPIAGLAEQITLLPSVTPCVAAIIAQLQELGSLSLIPEIAGTEGISHLSQIILDLFGASQQYHLNFQITPLPPGENASTSIPAAPNPVTGEVTYTTTLDDEYIANATTLAIARTIIHESVHALLAYLYQADSQTPFIQLLENYRTHYGDGLGEHAFMTQFAEAIGHSLAIWDNHSLPQAYYNNLAWSGDMTQTEAFFALPPEQQQAIRDANIAEGQANAPATANAQGTPCN